MTNLELSKLSNRVDEISEVLEICDDRFDQDVIDTLTHELDQIIDTIESSIKMRGAS